MSVGECKDKDDNDERIKNDNQLQIKLALIYLERIADALEVISRKMDWLGRVR